MRRNLALAMIIGMTASIADAQTCTLGSVIAGGVQCETSVAIGLTRQIANELTAMGVKFAQISGARISCTGGCSGFIQASALTSLQSVTNNAGRTIGLSSAWRSAAQQHLLYQYKAQGKCGQTNPVATPGTSNHEGGVAIDVPDYPNWKTQLINGGWNYPLPTSDKVHFEYGTGASAYAKQNLIAFQRLYNRRNPTAKIAEDGIYGPATAAAFNKAPCNGWAATLEEESTTEFLQ